MYGTIGEKNSIITGFRYKILLAVYAYTDLSERPYGGKRRVAYPAATVATTCTP